MAKLKDVISNQKVQLIAKRAVALEERDVHTVTRGEIERQQREIEELVVLLGEKTQHIQQLKATDERRSQVHRKLKQRLVQKKREVKTWQRKTRELTRIVRHRRHFVAGLLDQLRDLRASLTAHYTTPYTLHGGEATAPLPAELPNGLIKLFLRYYIPLHGLIWRYWMRLGVLRQYKARPVVVDKLPKPRATSAERPRISIVTPSYNQGNFLGATMESVLTQAYPALEYVVMDGGSTDHSVAVIEAHAASLKHWQSAPDGGQADAVRRGFQLTTGEIMGWLNSDDILLPGALDYVADYFVKHPQVDVVYGHRIIINSVGHEVGRWVLPRHDRELLLWVDFIPQETMFWRRDLYERVGGLDAAFQFALDWDLLLRFQKAGARMIRLPYFLGAFRLHEGQKNQVTMETQGYAEIEQLRMRELGADFDLSGLSSRVSLAQCKALICTFLLHIGLRW